MKLVDLQALQKKFNITEEELKNTVEELTKTKDELKDTNMVLDDRETVFDKLYQKADSTRTTGKDAISDVSNLHLKVQRTTTTINENQEVASSFIDSAKKEVQDLSSSVALANDKFMEQNNMVKSKLTSFQNETEAFTASVLDSIKELSSQFASFCREVNEESKSCDKQFTDEQEHFVKNINERIEGLSKSLESHVVEQHDFIESQNNAIDEMLGAQQEYYVKKLNPSLQSVSDKLVNFQNQFCAEDLSKYECSMQESTEKLLKNNQDFSASVHKHVENHTDKHEQLLEQHHQTSLTERQNLMENIQKMIDTFQTNQTNRLIEVIQETKSSNAAVLEIVDTHGANSTKDVEGISTVTKNFISASTSNMDTFVAEGTELVEIIKKGCDSNFNQVLKESGSNITLRATKYKDETFSNFNTECIAKINEAKETFEQEIESTKKSFRNKMIGFVDIIKTEKETFNIGTKDLKKEASNAKKMFKKTYDETYNGLKIMEENQKEHRAEFIAKHIDTIMQCIHNFSSSLRKDVPTGTTPTKKEYSLPTPFKKLDPRDIVLENLKRRVLTGSVIVDNIEAEKDVTPQSPSVSSVQATEDSCSTEKTQIDEMCNPNAENEMHSVSKSKEAVAPTTDVVTMDEVEVVVETEKVAVSNVPEEEKIRKEAAEMDGEAKENEIPSPSYQELLSNTSLKSNKGARKVAKSRKTKKMISSTDGQGKSRKTSAKSKLRLPAKTKTLSQLRM